MHKYKGKALAFVSLLAMLFTGMLSSGSPVYASSSASAHQVMQVAPGGWREADRAFRNLHKVRDSHGRWKTTAMPPSPFTGPGYYYGGAVQQFTTVTGLASKITIENQYLAPNPGEHTLMEIAINDSVTNDTLEWGWVKDGSGAGGPRLFTGYWVGGVWVNCYFGCSAWHDNGTNPINIGADLTSVATGCNGTTTLGCVKSFQFNYDATPCGPAAHGWYFYYDGVNVGCLESSVVSGMTSGDTSYAFSEVYYGGPSKPKTDMGNGKYGSTAALSAAGPAFFASISNVPSTVTVNMAIQPDTDSSAYTARSVGSPGNRSFSGGSGPGYKWDGANWVTPGDIGS